MKILEKETVLNKKKIITLPEKLFQVIYADPPWNYTFSRSNSRNIDLNQYRTEPLGQICDLKIPAADDCILYLWATAPKFEDAFTVMRAWGFEYKSNLIWDKVDMGMGYWSRVQHEILMIGVKGNMSPPDPAMRGRSIISVKKPEMHSRKPQEFRNLINERHPGLSKIELYARENEPGWAVFGIEAPLEPRATVI